jgi:cytosine/adenosine deaminase-related metal-dependent hydrolase
VLLTADWVIPVSGPPIRNGAILVKGHTIDEIGTIDDLAQKDPRAVRSDFPGCVITPGLVNAHTHLSLTVLGGLIPPQEFHDWIAHVPATVRALDQNDLAASASAGAIECLMTGATVVGDIAYGPEAPSAASDMGLAGTFFWEVLGIAGEDLERRLKEDDYPESPPKSCSGRARCGLSPHSPYTSGPSLLRAVRDLTRKHEVGFAVHIAESPAEVELIRDGTGPLAHLASRFATEFRTPGVTPVRYLHSLGALEGAVAVHCVHVPPADIPLLANQARGVVFCPRSNAYLNAGQAPVTRIMNAGARIGLGTDSSASNIDLDLLKELRVLIAGAPTISPERGLRIITIEGAEVLGLDDAFGSLEPGKQADISIWRMPSTDQPVRDLIEQGSGKSIEAVMSSGIWRIRSGQPAFPTGNIELAAKHAQIKAALALKGSQQSTSA